jgi:hypothetical protein
MQIGRFFTGSSRGRTYRGSGGIEGSMADAVLIGISVVFFVLAFAFVAWVDRL